MPYIASLVAAPGVLEGPLLSRVAGVLPGAEPPAWLAPDLAADIRFNAEAAEIPALLATARLALEGVPADLNIVSENWRRKSLILADMDSTMIEQECLDELADMVGLKAHVAAITERTMRGELKFEPALRERVALLKDLPLAKVDQVVHERTTLTPGARTLIATMRAHGAYTALISGGFTLFTGPVSRRIGFHEHRANVLRLDDQVLDGTVEEPILGRAAKRDALLELRESRGLPPEATLAIGDGANDLDMLYEAGLGVAFHAKPTVAAAARARIDHGDLTAVLYLQGYRRDEFAD